MSKMKKPIFEGLPPKVEPLTGKWYRIVKKDGLYAYQTLTLREGEVESLTLSEFDIYPVVEHKMTVQIQIDAQERAGL